MSPIPPSSLPWQAFIMSFYSSRKARKSNRQLNKANGRSRHLTVERLEDRLVLSTTVQVLAAGSSNTETMALEIRGEEVIRWTNIGGNFDLREYATYSYTDSRDDLNPLDIVVKMVDSAGTNRDLRVDGILFNGVKYESESNTTWATGTWDNNLQAIAPSFAQSEIIHANEGSFRYYSTAESNIQIRAAGKTNTETMRLWVQDQLVETWDNIGGNYDLNDFLTFTYVHPTKVSAKDIRVEFTNDATVAEGDRNLKIDAITIDGRQSQTESSTTFSTGTWKNGVIEPSFPESQSLHGNGYFQYSDMPEGGSNVIVYAAGKTGEETIDLRTGGRVVAEFESVGGDYFGREFLPFGFSHPRSLTLGEIEVGFSNDATSTAGDRNARVDAIVLDGVRHEAEDATTLSTGTWQPIIGVQPGFWQTEILQADGVFRFAQDPSQTGTLALGATQFLVNEEGSFIDVSFIRTGGTLGAVTIDYTTVDATAIAGQDYVAVSGTLVFSQGESQKNIRVTILNDNLGEGTEIFHMSADRVLGGAFLGQPRTATISIFDDEAPSAGNGNGLKAEYFSDRDLINLVTTRTDTTINFNWGTGSPGSGIPGDNFSVRWTGEVQPLYSETYTFETTTDDGVRLWVNDVLLIDQWVDQASIAHTGQITLQAGQKYDLRMEMYEKGGAATAYLRWSSAQQSKQIVATSQLYSEPVIPIDGQFSAQTIVSGLVQPTAIDFTEIGTLDYMFIAQKDGRVRLAINGVLESSDFLDYRTPVNNVRDRGLLGLAVHPDFINNPYVYVLYTYDPPETQGSGGLAAPDKAGNRGSRLTRVTADASTGYRSIVAGSEVVLLGTNSTWQYISSPDKDSTNDSSIPASGLLPNGSFIDDILITDSQSHSVGALAFAPDGSLYVSNGDGASYGHVDTRAIRVQDVDSLSGKVLRINPLTGEGYTDNPFYSGDITDDRSKVFNLGLRNPFRMSVDPVSGLPYVGDVGWTSWEEIDGGEGKNFGWPFYEGDSNGNAQTGGYKNLSEAQAFYASNPDIEAPTWARSHSAGGVAIIMGDFYTGNLYPTQYQGAAFFTDFGDPTIRGLKLDANGDLQQTFVVTGSVGTVVEMSMGPDGFMYYVDLVAGKVGRLNFVASASASSSSSPDAAATMSLTTNTTASPFVSSKLVSTPIAATDTALELLLIEENNLNQPAGDSVGFPSNSLEEDSEEQKEEEDLFALAMAI